MNPLVARQAQILRAVDEAADRVWKVIRDEERTGGYFCMMCRRPPNSTPEFIMRVGNIRKEEKAEKYFRLAQEKAARLRDHLGEGHVSSWQSRNPEKDEWGGAIAARNFIFSFSGFSPDTADEAVMLLAAEAVGELSPQEADQIAAISGNEIYRRICGRFFL